MTKQQPLITVIVPVHNVKDSIHQCVDSVLKQTYSNFELLLIDDGATDGSGDICDSYVEQDNRVRCCHKENGGVSSARNLGLDNAKGELITFLDSDDYFDPDMLEYLYGLLALTGANYSKCPARLVGWPLAESKEYSESDYQVYSEEEAVKNTLIGRLGFTGSSCHNLYKKSIIEDVRFHVSRSNEDLDFITRVAMRG
ncbi:MAG: glycosyltransferase family 2 protein, partial [Parabacteroides sp.]|nr:glycosyltransferase family 2 protein [Parabacteroides sp.]